MKANKHKIEMRCRGDLELHRALSESLETVKMRTVDISVAVEFGTVDNLGDYQFRYK